MEPNLLAQLKPIATPEPISWWPPAIGWIILFLLVLALLAFVVFKLWQKYFKKDWRKVALQEFKELKLLAKQNDYQSLEKLNSLLKRLALQQFDSARVANLSGENWLNFLDSTMPAEKKSSANEQVKFNSDLGKDLLESIYRKPTKKYVAKEKPQALLQIFNLAESWILTHQQQTE